MWGFSPPQAAAVSTQAYATLALAEWSELWYHKTMKQTFAYQRDEHHIHLIVYRLIWCPRRRKLVLVDKIAERCQHLIEQKCQEKGWQILTLATQPDHLHLFIRRFPSK
jgi:Transposase IS200 like